MSEPRCLDLLARLSDYVDGTLDASVCARIDAHMAGCKPCRAFIRNLRRTIRALRAHGRARPPDGLRARLRRQLRDCESSS